MTTRWRSLVGLTCALLGLAACSAVLGVDDYGIAPVIKAPPLSEAGAPAEGAAHAECTINADCKGRGDHWVCRPSDRRCVSLASAECPTVIGDYQNDHAVIIGSILPLTGPDTSTGIPSSNAIGLALADFGMVNGLPPTPGSTARRPLVVVSCTDASDPATAERSAHHLVDDLKMPAIIGAGFDRTTTQVATDVTIPAGVLLLSPLATSIAMTNLADEGLVWRTATSDTLQAKADLALFPEIESDIVARLPSPRNIKVAIASKGDTHGSGLAQAVSAGLSFNGKSALSQTNAGDFAEFDYGDEPDPNYAKAVTGITAQKPDAIFLFGTTEALTEVMKGIEIGWPSGVARPLYIVAGSSLTREATDIANGTPATPDSANLRKRIVGTFPGTNGTNASQLQILYESKISDGTSPSSAGTASSYDALYSLAFAVVAAGDHPLTGASIAAGFAKQVDRSGGTIDVGTAAGINAAFQKLTAGLGFDLVGASGALDYDLTTGEAPNDVQIWCLPATNGKAAPGEATGVFYKSSTGALSGSYAQVKSACAF